MKRFQFLLIVFFPLLAPAQEKIFYNASIFTANSSHPFAEAIAIKDKRIMAVGNYSEVIRSVSTKAELIDCKGGFLMPGLVDSHNHGISGGRGLTKANVSDQLMTIDELVAYAKSELEKKNGMTGDVLDRDGFAGKRAGHVDRAFRRVGDAVAAMAKPRNGELFSHAQLQAGIRCFHLHRGSAIRSFPRHASQAR